ncbi:hypothetical protein F8S09_14575 [Deinococcus sp. SDU3-2]|uniref:S9 family peptidase n=1 Tax=Deinococcus terrestris TaxID=2651870 RepID=A0A7X1NYX4_9DEIO|nr:hypothetical protein [Deinococcus terrestris]MPY67889.1 hypothetical protein [Deinococcus terrestris]
MPIRTLAPLLSLSLLLAACSSAPQTSLPNTSAQPSALNANSTLSAQASMSDRQRALAFAPGVHPVNPSADWQGQAFSADGRYLLFKVYSAAATRMQVDLYDAAGQVRAQLPLTRDAATGLW